jgi:hypothetical protein
VSDEIEDIWIICSDWSIEQLQLLPGNETTSCVDCRRPLVISTEGLAMRGANPLTAKAICMACATRRLPERVPEVLPGAVERARQSGYALSPRTIEAMHRTPLKDYEAKGLS